MSLEKSNIPTVKKQLNNLLTPDFLTDLAKESKFIQRSTNRINAFDFVYLMTIDLLSNPLASLEELCRCLFELNPSCKLMPQSLSGRINSKECVEFFKHIFLNVLKLNREKMCSLIDNSLLSPFNKILTGDSTQIQLNPLLSEVFGGSGGSGSESAAKLDLIEDIKNGHIESVEIYDGKKPDQSLSEKILDLLSPNDLVLRDLGYFKIEVFAKIISMGAFFLSRFLTSTNVYDPCSEKKLDLVDELSKSKYKSFDTIELNVLLGSKYKLPVRLIAYRLPDSVVNDRRRKAKATAKKKKYTLSKKHLALLAFSIYVTNVSVSVWPAKVVGTIYRLRWSIELTFKRWKSLLKIDFCKGTNPQRIYTLIYSRLIAIVLLHHFYLVAAHFTKSVHNRELSPHKIYQWLIQKQRLATAILNCTLKDLWNTFTELTLSFCKQKRKRMTVLEMIQNEIDFLDSFKNNHLISIGYNS